LAGPVAQATSRNTAVGILLATALGGGSSGSAERAPAAIPAPGLGWTLVWSDEFEGPSSALVDAAKWAFNLGGGGWGNQELETYTDRPRNASLTGEGTLAIQALGETFTGADGITREYTSARLKTQGKFDKAYSRCEARLRVPRGQGLWPAFWMLGADIGTVGWPRCGEIDVMESSMAMVSAEGSTPTSSIARRQRAYVTQRSRRGLEGGPAGDRRADPGSQRGNRGRDGQDRLQVRRRVHRDAPRRRAGDPAARPQHHPQGRARRRVAKEAAERAKAKLSGPKKR
jgi:hypothetical protein